MNASLPEVYLARHGETAWTISHQPQAADLFGPIYDETDGVDGWVSLEVSPLLAYDTTRTIAQARELHARARRYRQRVDVFEGARSS